MHLLLEKLFKKRDIKDVSQLREDEKVKYDYWEFILSEGDITVDKILIFCKNQKKVIENQWRNLDNNKDKNERLIINHIVYSLLIDAIEFPKKEKRRVEQELQELLQ